MTFASIRDAGAAACDAECSVLSGLPCLHACTAATKLGRSIEQLIHPIDTTAGWRDLYAGPDIRLPTTASIQAHVAAGLVDTTLALPPVLPPKRGGEKQEKRKAGFLERCGTSKKAKRRKPVCNRCFQIGHYKNKCTTIIPGQQGGPAVGGAAAAAAAEVAQVAPEVVEAIAAEAVAFAEQQRRRRRQWRRKRWRQWRRRRWQQWRQRCQRRRCRL